MARWRRELTKDLDAKLIVEPGRLIAANAGILVSRVVYVKQGEAKTFRDPRRWHERSAAARAL